MCKGALAFSVMALCVKFASKNIPSLEIVFFRSLFGSLMIFAILLKKKHSVFGTNRILMSLRGFIGFLALTLHFYTIAHMPLGTAVMLNYTGPIFAAILAVIFLKEKPGAFLVSMTVLSFAGVYFLLGGQPHSFDFMAFLGLLSAVFVGMVYVLIRAIHDRESPFTIIFYFTLVSTVGSIFFLPFGFRWPGLVDWLFLLGVGVGSFYGQLWFTLALRYAPTATVGPFAYLTPLLSFLYGVAFFNEAFTRASLLGAGMIILSGSLISYVESKKV